MEKKENEENKENNEKSDEAPNVENNEENNGDQNKNGEQNQNEENNNKEKDNEIKDKENKDISQKEGEKIAILDCGHRFHDRCIIEWLKKHSQCPICRVQVKFEGSNDNIPNFSRNLQDDYTFIIDIQSEAYPDEINYRRRNRIISSFEDTDSSFCKDKNNSSSDTNYSSNDSGRDFSDFDSGSGGATSDW